MNTPPLTPSSTPLAPTPLDFVRQSLNLVLAPLMWLLSSIWLLDKGARSASDFSDMSENLLVPAGVAFSIWFPIFIGVIGYGLIQALPRNRTREVFRAVGWWTALGFALICGWALITAYAPSDAVQWGSALIFVPAVSALITATIKFSRRIQQVNGLERLFTWASISLIAGWCSLAVFLNWTPTAYTTFADGQADTLSSLLILAAALGLIIAVCRAAACNKVYILPAVWGLAWLAVRHLLGDVEVPAIGWAALVGILLLIGSALLMPRVPIAGYAPKS